MESVEYINLRMYSDPATRAGSLSGPKRQVREFPVNPDQNKISHTFHTYLEGPLWSKKIVGTLPTFSDFFKCGTMAQCALFA